MNDMPMTQVAPDKEFHLFLVDGRTVKELTTTVKKETTLDLIWSELKIVEPQKK